MSEVVSNSDFLKSKTDFVISEDCQTKSALSWLQEFRESRSRRTSQHENNRGKIKSKTFSIGPGRVESNDARVLVDFTKTPSGYNFWQTISDLLIEVERVDIECNSEFVTGKLVGINILDKKLQIQLTSGRSLDVNYSNVRNAENILNENLDKVLHVHGQVTYNEFDELLAISNVDQLLAVDVSPITVKELVVENNCYTINPPLKYEVQFDYDEYFYTLEGDLDILTFGYSRMEIEGDLDYLLKKFCANYIQGKAKNLAADALIVQKKMLERFELN